MALIFLLYKLTVTIQLLSIILTDITVIYQIDIIYSNKTKNITVSLLSIIQLGPHSTYYQILMDKHQNFKQEHQHSQNADLQYILDLFNNEELNLTITEDTQQNQRSSRISHKKSQDSVDIRQQISDAKYRFAFLNFFKRHRQTAVIFIDTAIRFMNAIKKMKMEDLLKQLSEEQAMPRIIDSLILPELLIEPIEDELAFTELTESDTQRYTEALKLLKSSKELKPNDKIKIQHLLSQIQSR